MIRHARSRIPVSERTLRRWLASGKPSRVTRRLEWDGSLDARLDEISGFDEVSSDAFQRFMALPDDFEERTGAAVRGRIESASVGSLLADIATIAFRTGQVLAAPDAADLEPTAGTPDDSQ